MQVKLTSYVELEVEVRGSVDFPVQPHGFDPGDPGSCELEAVLVKREGMASLNLLDVLPPEAVRELEEQLQVAAEEQAQDAYNAVAEARYDAMKEGE